MQPFEIKKIQTYLNSKFKSSHYSLKVDSSEDSAEVYFNEEFIGLVYRDDEDGEIAYQFHMTILSEDLLDG